MYFVQHKTKPRQASTHGDQVVQRGPCKSQSLLSFNLSLRIYYHPIKVRVPTRPPLSIYQSNECVCLYLRLFPTYILLFLCHLAKDV